MSLTTRKKDRRSLLSWCFYDWANSAFPTVITTFVFAAYFTQAVAPSVTQGTAYWGHGQSLAGILIAVLGPVLGAIADKGGRRKPWIFTFTALAVVASACLWFTLPDAGYVIWALGFVVLGTLGFEFGMIFYNAMLPDLVSAQRIGRLSGWGWSLGYAGGLACLTMVLLGLIQTDTPWFGLDPGRAEPVRAAPLLVALWFAVFSLPLFLFTRDKEKTGATMKVAISQGIGELVSTLKAVKKYATIARFLLARMFYIDGLNTLFAFGGIYAAGTFAMAVDEIILFGIAMNVTAGLGAALFAWADDFLGSKKVILISLVGLIGLGTALLLVEGKTLFWVFALPLGLFVGPTQAASRSYMAHLAPPDMRTQMFGLFALSGKATAFLGPLVLAWVTLVFDSQRAGMATIMVFIGVGFVLLLPLKDPGRP